MAYLTITARQSSFLDDAITLSPEYADAYTLRGFMKEQLK